MNADVIIIGSGQGGMPLAMDFSKRGRHVVLFERENVGGSCINYGCTPSKTFLASAHVAARARQARALGVRADVTVDFPFVMNRVRGLVSTFRDGVRRRLAESGVDVILGEATFSDVRTVRSGDVEVTAPIVVINTGSSPAVPDIPGLRDVPYLTNKSFFSQTTLPDRCLVLGGGYVGLELGQGIAHLGSKVHIHHSADRLLNTEEPAVSAVLSEALEEDGVKMTLNARPTAVSFDGAVFELAMEDGSHWEGEQLLVATGRRPNTAELHAERSGVMLHDNGYVDVSPRFQTSCEGVYAIGEVCGQPAFTHVAWEDYRRLLSILDGGNRRRDDRVLGYAIFTEPQIGRVGLTYDQARMRGINARSEEVPVAYAMRAIEWGQERGFYRMVVDRDTDKIIGATLAGYEAAELVHVFIALIQSGSTWRALDDSVYIHPTFCEAFPSLARLFYAPPADEATA
ncbi:MAG TPA: FAD-dependent oxidoreductase [Candidatus Acidoferrales bacterium]|nr:FAD-dependent oxidoreductase [Candidatus Acidoferrales bacterium]